MSNVNISQNSAFRQSVLELRTRLAEEEITVKGYRKDIEKLLSGIGEDVRARFAELEHRFDSGEIDRAEYERCLAEIFPDKSGDSPIPGRPDDAYDVFLSYSHKDRDEFGAEYIIRIKEDIEKSLAGIVDNPRVFLDAEALHLGDLWHSKIIESLNQCKAIVCLVSEAYLKSEYCTRERLWWNAKQTRNCRFLDGPYPVYFVKLEKGLFSERQEVKEMMAVQTEPLPWFEVKKKLQEDFIRERLSRLTAVVCGKVRTAGLAGGSFCSVLPPLYENFVGRVTELQEIHELCVNGKHPVIQAGGGVGKTELSVAYAYGFADQYPMGRFLFRMERVTSWDEAFVKALNMNGTDAQGKLKTVFEELNIDEKTLQNNIPAELHRAAAKAFLERASKGKLLILLDNLDGDTTLLKKMRNFLCDSPLPENIHILATTRGAFHFGQRDRFVSYELKNLKEDEAFEMICLTGNGQYPFDKLPPSVKNPEYQAAHDVIRFLDGHAWSMEIISAFVADNYDPEGFNFATELDSLRKNTCLSTDFTYRAGEDSTTAIELLRPTLDKLATLDLGAETLELAVFAACFDPDEIPLYLLKEYWDMNFPDTACSQGEPFSCSVNLLVKYHLLRKRGETVKMHRLVQSVFLSRKKEHLSQIIRTLPKCSFVPAKYWVPVLLQNPELADICPLDGTLAGEDWAKLLTEPIFENKCPWQSFSGDDLGTLLACYPQFADKCDWSKLDSDDWFWLLRDRPEFADRCDLSKLGDFYLGLLLNHNPEFVEKCDWSKLNGWGWSCLLVKQPQFADRCDWNRLNGCDWVSLLKDQPQFADHCDWNKLGSCDWVSLLKDQPQFSDRCDWNKFDSLDWGNLLSERPDIAKNCDFGGLDGWAWAILLEKQPQFAEQCDWSKLVGGAWAWLLRKQPQFADKCDWNKLNGENWMLLLAEQPQFADKCDWNKLNGENWTLLLEEQPQFADKCDWSKLNGSDWWSLLSMRSEFADKCDWSKLDGEAWAKLLEEHPEWSVKIPFSLLSSDAWGSLLGRFPKFADKCDWGKLDGKAWARLLVKLPQFADKCQWYKLSEDDWTSLLQETPEFAASFDWNRLNEDDWNRLSGFAWAVLLANRPQFAERCNWYKLDGWAWVILVCSRPQFADCCDWSKLDDDDWTLLLKRQPQFVDKRPRKN